MTTISVPLTADLLKAIEDLIKHGKASNKADAVRKALGAYIEQQIIDDILHAERGPRLKGDLRTLAKRFR